MMMLTMVMEKEEVLSTKEEKDSGEISPDIRVDLTAINLLDMANHILKWVFTKEIRADIM